MSIDITGIATALSGSRVFELGHPMQRGMPVHPNHPPYYFTMGKRHGDSYREGGYSAANDVMMLSGHHGTHMDALGHVSVNDRLHGDVVASDVQRGLKGLTDKDISQQAPVVAPAVVLDLPGLLGIGSLEPGHLITEEQYDAALDRQGVTVGRGYVVLFRTGWAQRWNSPADFYPADGAQPGPGADVARRLSAAGVIAAGSDTMSFECVRPGQNSMPGHSHLLVEAGIPIMEMLDLEEVSAAGVHRLLFVALPLRIVGATGSPIRPIGIG
ncbi:cyclase family protein [Nakamurella sp. YIM 132087]|uniref:Cyclase family protein n=1 Tax=Nakamurella alba TaxID=2665158 RepID=A0A7K1FSP0_9ACTN|nr:cyclase family protein [Nakamurella alba]MTD17177.1 cyclase family protein [Nakamurella alba]